MRRGHQYAWSTLAALLLVFTSLLSLQVGAGPSKPRAIPLPAAGSPALPAPLIDAEHPTTDGTLLDEVGRLRRPVPAGEVQAWKRELKRARPSASRAVWLHLWLGEVELAQNEEPRKAIWHFRQVQRRCPPTDLSYGLAAYNTAMAVFFDGAYDDAAEAFQRLLAPKTALSGYDPRRCALWLRQAEVCAGYHAQNAKLGITWPGRVSHLSGASSLAVCLKALRLPYDKKSVLRVCRVTGMGSTAQDIVTACQRLGLAGRAFSGDEEALKALPKPLVAHVEHDHFVAIIRADTKGVSYVCEDCGPWPGGRRELTWKQYRAMDPGVYITVSRRGSVDDRRLSQVRGRKGSEPGGVRLAAAGPLRGLSPSSLAQLTSLVPLQNSALLTLIRCAWKPEPDQRSRLGASHPMDAGGIGPSGPSCGDPVDLATLEEEYQPEPDLIVYNPHGPAVVWRRLYNSLRGPDRFLERQVYQAPPNYQPEDLGIGWSHPYNVVIRDRAEIRSAQVAAGTTAEFGAIFRDRAPAAGLLWDIVRNGVIIATSTDPKGWSVTLAVPRQLTVGAPESAIPATNYEVRFKNGDRSLSAAFDVLPLRSIPIGLQDRKIRLPASDREAPGPGLAWDIVRNGSTIASSTFTARNGWAAELEPDPPRLSVSAPLSAAIGSGYKVRFRHRQWGTFSASFSLVTKLDIAIPRSGSRTLVLPNGALVKFEAPAVPTALQRRVSCRVNPGIPLTIDWEYDPSDALGHYVITFADGTRWITSKGTMADEGRSFEFLHLLTRIEDRSRNALDFRYVQGVSNLGLALLSSIHDASTGKPLLTIQRKADGTGNIVSVSDAYGRSVYYQVGTTYRTEDTADPIYHELERVSQIVPTGAPDRPFRWIYTYKGYLPKSLLFLRTITVPSPTGTGMSTTTLDYDNDSGLLTRIVDANGSSRSYTRVRNENSTRVTVRYPAVLDPERNLVREGDLVFSYTVGYDGGMNETTRTDGTNRTVILRKLYSSASHHPHTVIDGNGRMTKLTWDRFGQLESVTSPRGTRTVFTRDYSNFRLGRLVRVQEGTKPPVTISYYEPSGLVQSITTPAPGLGVGATATTAFTYDSLGNILTVTGPGNNASPRLTTTFNYTRDGAHTQPAALGQPLTITDNLGKVTHLRYDARGNPVEIVDALNRLVNLTYNVADQPVAMVNPANGPSSQGRTSTGATYLYPGGPLIVATAYDERRQAVRQVSYAYGREGELRARTGSAESVAIEYDGVYRTKVLTDGNRQRTAYGFNEAGYLERVTYPAGDSVLFPAYDPAGNLLKRMDSGGTTLYEYKDPDGGLSQVSYSHRVRPGAAGNQGVYTVRLAYDEYGRRSVMHDDTGTTSYAYDDLDNIISVTTAYTGLPARTIDYQYYPDSSLQTLTTPAGAFSYRYDAGGRMVGLTNPFGESFGWSYLDNGWLASQQLANGVVANYSYSPRGFLTHLVNRTSRGALLSEFREMACDAVGNRTAVTTNIPALPALSGRTEYAYDQRDQLLQEQSSRSAATVGRFAYDAAGNPLLFRGTPRSFNANNQDTANTYDGNGNPILYRRHPQAAPLQLDFQMEDRLTGVGGASFAGYTGDGLRAWKQTSAGRRFFLYDGTLPVLELDARGAVTAVNTFGPNGLLARRAGGTSVFYTFDPQGSVVQRLDSAGGILSTHGFDAYGAALTRAATTDPFGYGAQWGYYTDVETGLLLLTYRYYDPSTGRFLNRDPIGYAGGLNLHSYAGNAPVNQVDPLGLLTEEQKRQWVQGWADLGTGIGFVLGAIGGGGGGAAGGTLVVPGVGTIAGGYQGAVAGAAGGAIIGRGLGAGAALTWIAVDEFVAAMGVSDHEEKLRSLLSRGRGAPWGVTGNVNKGNIQRLADALDDHLKNAAEVWQARYRGKDALFHIIGDRVVVTDPCGGFISAWQATPAQLRHYRSGIRIQ